MTKKIIPPMDKSIYRVSLSLTKAEDTLLKNDFEHQSQYTTLATYAKAIVLGKAENRKSTILNVPSINRDTAKQIRGIATNINQYLTHLNYLIKNTPDITEDLHTTIMKTSTWLVDLHVLLKNFTTLLNDPSNRLEDIKLISFQFLSSSDLSELLTQKQFEEFSLGLYQVDKK